MIKTGNDIYHYTIKEGSGRNGPDAAKTYRSPNSSPENYYKGRSGAHKEMSKQDYERMMRNLSKDLYYLHEDRSMLNEYVEDWYFELIGEHRNAERIAKDIYTGGTGMWRVEGWLACHKYLELIEIGALVSRYLFEEVTKGDNPKIVIKYKMYPGYRVFWKQEVNFPTYADYRIYELENRINGVGVLYHCNIDLGWWGVGPVR